LADRQYPKPGVENGWVRAFSADSDSLHYLAVSVWLAIGNNPHWPEAITSQGLKKEKISPVTAASPALLGTQVPSSSSAIVIEYQE